MKPRPKKTEFEKSLASVRRLIQRVVNEGVGRAVAMGNTRNGLPDGEFKRLDDDLEVLERIAELLERNIAIEKRSKILPMKGTRK